MVEAILALWFAIWGACFVAMFLDIWLFNHDWKGQSDWVSATLGTIVLLIFAPILFIIWWGTYDDANLR